MKLVFAEVYFANLVYTCPKLDSIFNIVMFQLWKTYPIKNKKWDF